MVPSTQDETRGEPSRPRKPSTGSIPLYLVNGVATVWDAQVAATLHCTHSISGLRTGTLPGVSQQNGFLGLPLSLMQEETAFLLSAGVAHLVPLSASLTLPSAQEVESNTRERMAKIRRMEEAYRVEEGNRQVVAREAFERGGEQAREKREARERARVEKARLKGEEEGDGILGNEPLAVPGQGAEGMTVNEKGEEGKGPSDNEPQTFSSAGHFHIVPAVPIFPRLVFGDSITTLPHTLFPFPSTSRDRALVDTFSALHERGYRMGLGPRFGGEYLVYPGDYLRYHAHFTSQVVARDEPIKPTEIVAWGRLGTGTKKAGLICCWDDGGRSEGMAEEGLDKREVEFYSLEWANFG